MVLVGLLFTDPMLRIVCLDEGVELQLCYALSLFTHLRKFRVAWAIVARVLLRLFVFNWYS